MVNTFYDCYVILNKVYGEKAFIKQAITDTPIEEKNRAVTTKICYGVLDKDITLSYYIKYLAPKSPKLAVRTILKIATYSIKFLGKKPYAVTDAAVELTKKLGKGGASGFVNAFLRKFISADIPLPNDKLQKLSVEYSYPEFVIKDLIKTFGKERTERIAASEVHNTTVAFYEKNGEEYLKDRKFDYEKTPFVNVYNVKNFVRNADYDAGVYTYQSIGSVAICEAVSGGKNLLDCCAAPGGKTVRLSHKFDFVTSWDIYPHRVELIEDYVKRMKRENVIAEVCDAKVFNPLYEKSFDAVLCDAPCSGTGVMSDNPDIKLNREESDVLKLIEEQKLILNTVCRYVKENGFLYYSTCSIMSVENYGVIKEFLVDHTEYELVATDSPLPHEKIDKTLQFLPDISGGCGFYFAKLKRKHV